MDEKRLKYLTNVFHNDREILRAMVMLLVDKDIFTEDELCDEILKMRSAMEQEKARRKDL